MPPSWKGPSGPNCVRARAQPGILWRPSAALPWESPRSKSLSAAPLPRQSPLAPKLQTLPRPFLEFAAGGASVFVDAARVGVLLRTQVYTRALVRVREGHFAEVAGDELFDEVRAARAFPTDDVCFWNEDASIAGLAAALAARQAIKLE